MKTSLFTALFLLTPLLLNAQDANTVVASSPEIITDVNLEFFLASPRTTWGPDLFKKHPGFIAYTPSEEKFVLQGIARNENGSTAVINGKVMKRGDNLGSRKIAEIGSNFVVLEKDDSQVELVLPPAPPSNKASGEREHP